MSVNLQKGQRVDLRKANGTGVLRNVMVGLGWDQIEQRRGLFSRPAAEIDCDASAFMLKGGKLYSNSDVVYFGNLKHSTGTVVHQGDNLTGEGDGDDEQIFVDLQRVPNDYDKIVFVVNIYQANQRNQHFGMISNAFIRICDADNGTELCKYNLSENYDRMTAMVFGEIYRYGSEWKFNAIGQPTTDNDIASLARRYGL